MSDPFLIAHRVDGAIFDISSGLRPGSVRDQIIRGMLIVERAYEAGIISPSKSLFVLGAGAAGSAAAIYASTKGIPTMLIDRDEAFSRQRGCSTRQLEPTLYDWPADHWHKAAYPWLDENPALRYVAADAASVAEEWTRVLEEARRAGLEYSDHTDILGSVQRLSVDPAQYEVTLQRQDGSDAFVRRPHMIIVAAGPGIERAERDPGFRSFKFWDKDPLRTDLKDRRVLIAGSGDGAIQDFLRALLAPETDLAQVVDALKVPADLLGRIQTLANQADANFIWCAENHHEHRSEAYLHVQMELIAEEFWRRSHDRIANIFDDSSREDIPDITLVHPCNHFTRGFPVNRIVAFLAQRWCHERAVGVTMLPNTKIARVPCPAPHHTAAECASVGHEVFVESAYCEAFPAGPARHAEPLRGTYDLILLRIGAKAEPLVEIPTDVAALEHRRYRQLLPFHLAHTYSSVTS